MRGRTRVWFAHVRRVLRGAVLVAGAALVVALVLARARAHAQETTGVRLWRFSLARQAPVCTQLSPGALDPRCGELVEALGSQRFVDDVVYCGRVEHVASSDPEGYFRVVLEVDAEGHVTRSDALPEPSVATGSFYECVQRAGRRIVLGRGLPMRIEQRWRMERVRRAGHGDPASPWHLLGEVLVGGGTIFWPEETRDAYIVGLRASMLYDWIGLTLAFDTTDGLDERPGAAVIWSVRLALRPELRISEEVTLFGALEGGIAMSSGQGNERRQRDDELAFSGLASIGVGVWNWTFAIQLHDAFSAHVHRLAGVLAIGGDFHIR